MPEKEFKIMILKKKKTALSDLLEYHQVNKYLHARNLRGEGASH